MAELARGKPFRKRELQAQALEGCLRGCHCGPATLQLEHIDLLGQEIAALSAGTWRQRHQAIRRPLTEAAWAIGRAKKVGHTHPNGDCLQLIVRYGKKEAAVAVRHTIVRIAPQLLTYLKMHQEQALLYLDERRRNQKQQCAVAQFKALGN